MTLFLAVAMALLGGCKPSTATAPAAGGPPLPTSAQPRLPTVKLYIGAQEIEMIAEVARTEPQQECGMMFRTSMGSNEGMIFLLPQPMRASFWMKNCPLPLSAAYIDSEGTIEEIHPLQPNDTNSVVASLNNVKYVLETPQGWFQRNGVPTGVVVRTEKGSLADTFSGRE